MNRSKSHNVIGAMSLALADIIRMGTQDAAPKSITAAGLTLIGHVPGISIQELSQGLELSHPGAVRLVDRMVANGLVTRNKSEFDHRSVALSLTPLGIEREADILASRAKTLGQALSHLSQEEITSLTAISEKLLCNIVDGEEAALRICRLCNSPTCDDCPVDVALENVE